RGQDHRGKLAAALQHRASAWIARLQAAGTRGLHPGIRAGGPATPTSDAARAGAATIIALTIKLDPSVGADQSEASAVSSLISRTCCLTAFAGAKVRDDFARYSSRLVCTPVMFRIALPGQFGGTA